MTCYCKPYRHTFYLILLLTILFDIAGLKTYGQEQKVADSLAHLYKSRDPADTNNFSLLVDLSYNELRDNKLALSYANELINLSNKTGYVRYLRAGYFLKGSRERLLGQLDAALSSFITSAELAEKQKNKIAEAEAYSAIADIYSVAKNQPTAGRYYRKAITTLRTSKDSQSLAATLFNAGDYMLRVRNDDSAFLYVSEAKEIYEILNDSIHIGFCLGNMGILNFYRGNFLQAEKQIKLSIKILEANHHYYPVCEYLLALADVYKEKNQFQKAINYAGESLSLAQDYKLLEQVSNACQKLSTLYQLTRNADSALFFYKLYIQNRDSLNNSGTIQKMGDLRTDFEVSQKQGEVNLLTRQKKTQKNLLLALKMIAIMAIIIVLIMVRSNLNKKKAFKKLSSQKLQTEEERAKAEMALTELRKTQGQLIQSAKMASLGELTAGIAHEIQNPLNFVNNFSEINKEMIDELQTELHARNIEKSITISYDIKANEEKINHHGKRADAIIKGMLQHSRKSEGAKELTDINVLCDEYLRLTYHGLRAKDNTINVTIKTDYDNAIGKINIIPQDIGRVILNLISNAFYAVDEKKKSGINNYNPTVSVSTKKINDKVEIIVSDNGNGIPSSIKEKIFQPFFTTKPTGQGTGLGLSLAYDIVKAHGGELKVESKEKVGTKFIIILKV